jgi:ribosome-associated heat shock protein Hsp15
MRIDKLLWFLRLAKTRTVAQALAQQGHIRLNGRRVERAHQRVGVGDVLVVPLAGGVRVIELLCLPNRRGPPAEARTCYRTLDEQRDLSIAAAERTDAAKRDLQP